MDKIFFDNVLGRRDARVNFANFSKIVVDYIKYVIDCDDESYFAHLDDCYHDSSISDEDFESEFGITREQYGDKEFIHTPTLDHIGYVMGTPFADDAYGAICRSGYKSISCDFLDFVCHEICNRDYDVLLYLADEYRLECPKDQLDMDLYYDIIKYANYMIAKESKRRA